MLTLGDMQEYKYSFVEVLVEYILTQRSWASPPSSFGLRLKLFLELFLASQLHVALVVEPVPGAERRRCI